MKLTLIYEQTNIICCSEFQKLLKYGLFLRPICTDPYHFQTAKFRRLPKPGLICRSSGSYTVHFIKKKCAQNRRKAKKRH